MKKNYVCFLKIWHSDEDIIRNPTNRLGASWAWGLNSPPHHIGFLGRPPWMAPSTISKKKIQHVCQGAVQVQGFRHPPIASNLRGAFRPLTPGSGKYIAKVSVRWSPTRLYRLTLHRLLESPKHPSYNYTLACQVACHWVVSIQRKLDLNPKSMGS